MLPVIGMKNYSAYIIDYGTNMFLENAVPSGSVSVSLSVREFFSVFDFTWNSSGSLPKHLQRQLLNLYPKVKVNILIIISQY